MTWEPVIGLEVHIQLLTKSKIFSSASTAFGALPNTQACAVDLGLPGILPVLNQAAVQMAVKLGLAIEGEIAKHSVFSRKNYFYPDLPKGYQISQYELPIVKNGHLNLYLDAGKAKNISIQRAHLEEDAGKSLHEDFQGMTGIDLNRAGVPLLEIVSGPDLRSAEEAVIYLKTLHTLVRYLEICDGNMQEGSFRCDVNVSVRKIGDKILGTRAEIKNLNSFRFIEKAIKYEIDRQIALLEEGGKITQETRLYDSIKNETRPMRSKEEAHDYRYFPDPDLLPLALSEEFINAVRATLPELPEQKAKRFKTHYGLTDYDVKLLTSSKETADYFEQVVLESHCQPKLAANWVMGDLAALLNKENLNITESPISFTQLGNLLTRIEDKTISGKIAKTIFEALWKNGGSVDTFIERQGLKQLSDANTLENLITEILTAHPQELADYRSGKTKLLGFFVGQVMKASEGKANPGEVNEILRKRLL